MLDKTVDDELELLGQIRTDVHAVVMRWIGEKPLTLDEVDSLLANLGEGTLPVSSLTLPVSSLARADSPFTAAMPARDAPTPPRATPAPVAVASEPAIVASAPAPVVSAVVASAPALTPAPLAEAPLTASAAPVFDSQSAPPSNPPPVFESRPASAEPPSLTPNVFESQPDPEAQAQAIVAAFEQTEVEQNSTESLAAELESSLSELEASTRAAAAENARALDAERPVRSPGRSQGSRRPDLNELLDQPLDALDFERTEPVDDDAPGAQARHSEMATGAPPAPGSGDDFEILVDDEILEIAEDDVEMVNDDEESN